MNKPHALLSTAACLVLLQNNAQAEVKIATLHNVQHNTNNISFTVSSNGCTQSKDFELLIDSSNNSLTILRLRRDMCRRRPFSQKITLPLHSPMPNLKITNPFSQAPLQAFPFPMPNKERIPQR
ncbi:MAG: hypothetical protein Q9O24_04405 [Gammaproteobacteria bacterium]|nr:hypothetical protein [Gammaproteobacteria bacterium]